MAKGKAEKIPSGIKNPFAIQQKKKSNWISN